MHPHPARRCQGSHHPHPVSVSASMPTGSHYTRRAYRLCICVSVATGGNDLIPMEVYAAAPRPPNPSLSLLPACVCGWCVCVYSCMLGALHTGSDEACEGLCVCVFGCDCDTRTPHALPTPPLPPPPPPPCKTTQSGVWLKTQRR